MQLESQPVKPRKTSWASGGRGWLVLTALMIWSWVAMVSALKTGEVTSSGEGYSTTYTWKEDPILFTLTVIFEQAPWIVIFTLFWLAWTGYDVYQWTRRMRMRRLARQNPGPAPVPTDPH